MNKLLMLLVVGLSACTANNNKEESVKLAKLKSVIYQTVYQFVRLMMVLRGQLYQVQE